MLVPTALRALMRKMYAVCESRSVTVAVCCVELVATVRHGPCSRAGAISSTKASSAPQPLLRLAMRTEIESQDTEVVGSGSVVGAEGFLAGGRVVVVTGELHAPRPTAFFAATTKRYSVPARRPLATKDALWPWTWRLSWSVAGPLVATATIS